MIPVVATGVGLSVANTMDLCEKNLLKIAVVVGSLTVPHNNVRGFEVQEQHQFMLEIEDGMLLYWDVNEARILHSAQYGRIIAPFLRELADTFDVELMPAIMVPRYKPLFKKALKAIKSSECSTDGGCGEFVITVRTLLADFRK